GAIRVIAKEVAAKGIRANAICPGYLDTEMTQNSIANLSAKTGKNLAESRAALEELSPQKRLFTPEEVAACAMFLLSDGARGINGQAISICGGELA
ncbi:MAG: SDR family oxidoreductase, partial [Planctomycetes bacterium]|nr:SDR family oxidoreductase [Planctomycetota bacterium]